MLKNGKKINYIICFRFIYFILLYHIKLVILFDIHFTRFEIVEISSARTSTPHC